MEQETQQFETGSGTAQPVDAGFEEEALPIPPQVAEALELLEDERRWLRRKFRPGSDDGKALKRFIANNLIEVLDTVFTVLGEGLTETYAIAHEVHRDQVQFRSYVLAKFREMGVKTGSPLLDGDMPEELVGEGIDAVALLGEQILAKVPEDEDVKERFQAVSTAFGELLEAAKGDGASEAGIANLRRNIAQLALGLNHALPGVENVDVQKSFTAVTHVFGELMGYPLASGAADEQDDGDDDDESDTGTDDDAADEPKGDESESPGTE